MVTNKKTKIIEFPSKTGTSSPTVTKDGIENYNDYEGYEDDEYFYLLEEKDYPDIDEYQHLLLDVLFGMGMSEDDYDWSKKPVVLRLYKDIIDACYLYLKSKRKPRSIYDIYNEFVFRGYVVFTPEDLLLELLDDERFIADDPEDPEMLRAVRKKDLKKLRKDK